MVRRGEMLKQLGALMRCLIGEAWAMKKIPALQSAELWYLEAAMFFIHGASMAAYVWPTDERKRSAEK